MEKNGNYRDYRGNIGVIEFRVYCLGFRVWINVQDPVSFLG